MVANMTYFISAMLLETRVIKVIMHSNLKSNLLRIMNFDEYIKEVCV